MKNNLLRNVVSYSPLIFLLAIASGFWLMSVGSPLDYFIYAMPPGQVIYVASKLVGLVAMCLCWFQLMAVLLGRHFEVLRLFQLDMRSHKLLGIVCFLAAILHVGLFVSAVSMRSGHFAAGLLLPRLDAGFYAFSVSLGLIALWFLVIAIAAAVFRRYLGRYWLFLHRFNIAAFGLFFLHGVFIGTESRLGVMRYFYIALGVSVAVSALACFWKAQYGAKLRIAGLVDDR